MKVDNHHEDLAVSWRYQRNKIPVSSRWAWKMWRMILFLCAGISIAVFVVWIRVQIVRVGYDISKANEERRVLFQAHEWLKIRSASLRSPERVEPIARGKLGLMPPERLQVKWLK